MDLFWKACGASGPLRLTVEDSRSGASVARALDQPFAILGRDPRADVSLDDDQVSRRHAYLQVLAGRVHVLDLGSRTGTRWAGGPMRSGWLGPGQELRIGPYRVRLDGLGPGSGPGMEFAARLPDVTLELSDESERTAWKMRGVLVLVGSKAGCKLRLVDPSVSTRHGVLIRTPGGPWVVDLLSRKGLSVGGSIVRFSPLEDGDVLQVGRFAIVVRCAPRADEAAAPQSIPGRDGPAPAPPDPALTALVAQFATMQRQMFDQFQQTVGALVQMFGSIHRDQVTQIREELGPMARLGEELHDLQAGLSTLAMADAPRPPDVPPATEPDATELDVSTAAVELRERLEAIEHERQARWRKILDLLPGLRDEKPAPGP